MAASAAVNESPSSRAAILSASVRDPVSSIAFIFADVMFAESHMEAALAAVRFELSKMEAALDAAKAGYDVTIVEKESSLGGYAAKVRKQLPDQVPYENLMPPVIETRIKELEAYKNITVKTNTLVARLAGEPGDFTVTLKKPDEKIEFDVPFPLPEEMKFDENGKELDVEEQHKRYLEYNEGKVDILQFDPSGEKFGAVVLAAGWRPYEAEGDEFAHLGYGELPDVVTNHQFEEMAAKGKVMTSTGKEAKSVVFIQSPAANRPIKGNWLVCP